MTRYQMSVGEGSVNSSDDLDSLFAQLEAELNGTPADSASPAEADSTPSPQKGPGWQPTPQVP